MSSPLVSVIMPVFNAEKYVGEAINSLLDQTYAKWELLIVNDGSTDRSQELIDSIEDHRIRTFVQENGGVSHARNKGLSEMNGDFFCFLDADDILPKKSIECRVQKMISDPRIDYLDGEVQVMDSRMLKRIRKWKPSFKGNPFEDLISLSGHSFFGITWMIRRNYSRNYSFRSDLTHGEDLYFFIEMAYYQDSSYDYVDECILLNRSHEKSAMKNIDGLADGYQTIASLIKSELNFNGTSLEKYHARVRRILFRSYLRDGSFFKAIRYL